MEQMESDVDEKSIKLSNNSLAYLAETSKWTKFLSILGFIFVGFIIIAAFVVGLFGSMSPFGGAGGILILFLYLIIAGIYAIPVYYLFKFSDDMKQALYYNQSLSVESAFENLKSHYKFIGIFTIVILGLYLLMLIIGLGAGISSLF